MSQTAGQSRSPTLWFIKSNTNEKMTNSFYYTEQLPWPRVGPRQRRHPAFASAHVSAVTLYTRTVHTFCSFDLAPDTETIFVFSLCVFLFIFIPLFEVVVRVLVRFDALMNGQFSCDALENGNCDSLPPSFLNFLSIYSGRNFSYLLCTFPSL